MNDEPKVDVDDTQELVVAVTDDAPPADPRRVDGEYGRFVIVEPSLGGLIEVSVGDDIMHELNGCPMTPLQVDALIARLQAVVAEYKPLQPDHANEVRQGEAPGFAQEAELSAALEAYIVADSEYQIVAGEWCAIEASRTATQYNRLSHARKVRAAAANRLGGLFPHESNILGMRVIACASLAIHLDGRMYQVSAAMLPIPHLTGERYMIKVAAPPDEAAP